MYKAFPRRFVLPLNVTNDTPTGVNLNTRPTSSATSFKTAEDKVWYQKGLFPSEPVFVPSPEAVEEDDGVILSVVVTPTEDKRTFLLVLNARTWEELGRAEVPVNVPYGFHGAFNSTA
ncbi:beta,beta-carotene 9',10'-oxygenase [Salmo salar]|uniref:Carotenoid-cleaving dioxygenase, mitochondrial n=1 Tax=Salmo salar TaxID=8030 RepID=A0ABM3EEP0_SALSA|nr:beta,beta-carotene 9',10'-oxygenase-like [Salmo salar]|eukprot:XP_014068816.1 PREDICTED: beta,beta-carotene 9',10'-oxygenase-like [Salmo salar]